MNAEHPYVEERNGTYYVRGQRVPVSALAYDWNNGIDVDAIAKNFPILKISEVLGALAYYLDHRAELDPHFAEMQKAELEMIADAQANRSEHLQELHRRFAAIRKRQETSAS